jgi:hypothetical protein
MEPTQLMDTYISLRGRGMSRVDALNHLYGQLCKLPSVEAQHFVDRVRALETERGGISTAIAKTRKLSQDDAPQPLAGITCRVCSWVNTAEERVCAHCKTHLPASQLPIIGTSTLYQTPHERTPHFTADMWLMLRIPNQHVKFELDPYMAREELIVGRSDANNRVAVDLSDHAGILLGVSRAHLGLHADPDNAQLIGRDMGSRNGLFVNGRRVAAHELFCIQHGDQLELGRLILLAFFIYRRRTLDSPPTHTVP